MVKGTPPTTAEIDARIAKLKARNQAKVAKAKSKRKAPVKKSTPGSKVRADARRRIEDMANDADDPFGTNYLDSDGTW